MRPSRSHRRLNRRIALALIAVTAPSVRAYADDNDQWIGRTPPDPSLIASPAPTPSGVSTPSFQDGGPSSWRIEGMLAAGGWSSGALFNVNSSQLDVGGVASFGFRAVRRWRRHTPIESVGDWGPALMWLTVGLIALPADAWFGNEQGLDLRMRTTASPAPAVDPWNVSVGLAPVFRISRNGARVRFPSIVGALLPEAGFAFGLRTTSAYVLWSPFPVAVMLSQHVGLEFAFDQGVTIPLDGSSVRIVIGGRIGVLVR